MSQEKGDKVHFFVKFGGGCCVADGRNPFSLFFRNKLTNASKERFTVTPISSSTLQTVHWKCEHYTVLATSNDIQILT